MNTRLRTVLLVALVATLFLLAVSPALAVQLPEVESEKITMPESTHLRIGLAILGIAGLMGLAAFVNAIQQLKGRRGQADGKFRWR